MANNSLSHSWDDRINEIIDAPYVDFDLARDYVNIRNRFLKGYTSIAGEPGWFYFKIIFDFNSSALLSGEKNPLSAYNFLKWNTKRFQYVDNNVDEEKIHIGNPRIEALVKFQRLLKFLAVEAPWCFTEVSGVADALDVDFSKPGDNNKTIKITCAPETIDFRMSLLTDLYKYIAYDFRNQRLILPENMRKFNMSILFFSVPIKWHQTPIANPNFMNDIYTSIGVGKNPGWKTIFDSLSAKVVSFHDCEFVLKSMSSGWDTGNNEKPFQTKFNLEINFNRAYSTTISEWFKVQVDNAYDRYYFGTAPGEGAPEAESNSSSGGLFNKLLGGFIEDTINTVKDTVDAFSDMFSISSISKGDDNERTALIRDNIFWGSRQNVGQKIAAALNTGVNTLIGGLNDYVTLGNIYDDSWLSIATEGVNSDNFLTGVFNRSLGIAANNLNSPLLQNLVENGIGGVTNTYSQLLVDKILGRTGGSLTESQYYTRLKGASVYNRVSTIDRMYHTNDRLIGFMDEMTDSGNYISVDAQRYYDGTQNWHKAMVIDPSNRERASYNRPNTIDMLYHPLFEGKWHQMDLGTIHDELGFKTIIPSYDNPIDNNNINVDKPVSNDEWSERYKYLTEQANKHTLKKENKNLGVDQPIVPGDDGKVNSSTKPGVKTSKYQIDPYAQSSYIENNTETVAQRHIDNITRQVDRISLNRNI